MLQRKYHFHEPNNSCCRIQMSDIGLNRSQVKGFFPLFAQNARNGANFDGVTQRRAGAVGFHIVDLVRIQPGVVECFLQHGALRLAAGCRDCARLSVMIDGRALYDRKDSIAIGAGVAKPLERNDAATLALPKSVGAGIKCLASPIWRKRCHLANADEMFWRQYKADTTGKCQFAFA